MKRIAGIVNLDRAPVAPEEMQRMIHALAFQACDEQEAWTAAGVGLACTRTASGPGARRAPLLSLAAGQDCVLAFDGRIDNRPELLPLLKASLPDGRPPVSAEELVLAAYRRWGLESPARLRGDFAFALWDGQRRRLVCARDPFGVKPLYFALCNHAFVFASTPRAVLASGKVLPLLYEERIADFLVNPLEGIDQTSSFYQDVFRLPPAHTLVVEEGEARVERYWELRPPAHPECKTEPEYVEAFRELFREAVCCRLEDQPAPATMLSGGLDSSAIVGMGRAVLAGEGRGLLQAFAVLSNSPHTNRETSHISAVLAQGNLCPNLISETEVSRRMDELVGALEGEAEPFDCLMNLNRAVYLQARERKVHALLDGVDGDILLSGSGHLSQLWRTGAIGPILGETFRAGGLTAEYKMGRKLFFSSLLSTVAPIAPDWVRRLRRERRYRKAVDTAARETIIKREFAARCRLGERFARLDAHRPRPPVFTQAAFHKIALEHTFLTVGLERYERVASAFGIEARHPFTDVRLAEFCLGLPWQLKTQRGWTKMVLRRALEPDLPHEVVWRKDKDSLMWEVNRLVLKARADYFYQVTLDEQASLKQYINMPKLMSFWQAYLTQGDEKEAESLWTGAALAMWLRGQRNLV